MVSFGCYDNSDFIATRIITNFHLYLNKYNCGGNFSKCLFMVSQSMLKKNFTGIDPEKLYRATFICQYGLCCCIVWPSFLFDCFVKIWATCKSFLGKWFTAPPGKKLPVRLCLCRHFFCVITLHTLPRIFSLLFRTSNHQIVGKKSQNKTEFAF